MSNINVKNDVEWLENIKQSIYLEIRKLLIPNTIFLLIFALFLQY